jgi:hypothetical protein
VEDPAAGGHREGVDRRAEDADRGDRRRDDEAGDGDHGGQRRQHREQQDDKQVLHQAAPDPALVC